MIIGRSIEKLLAMDTQIQIILCCSIFCLSIVAPQGFDDEVVTSDVVILGGGMAGVTAAKTLMEYGIHDIIVVEGGDELGGRVKSASFGGVNVELGANWVQFSRMDKLFRNPVEEMVKDAQLEYVEDYYDDYIFRENGANVTKEADDIYEQFEEALTATLWLTDLTQLFRQPDINFRTGFSINNWRPSTPLEKAVEFFDFDFELGDEPSQTSLKNNANEFSHRGKQDMFIKDQRGYSQIIKNVANKIPLVDQKNLYLSHYVDEVKYNETGDYKILVKAYLNKNNTKSNKYKMFKAKWAIMTFSIGVLQSNQVNFLPALPNWKLETISKFSMTCYTKIFVKFNKNITRFWDNNHYIFYVNPEVRGHYQTWQNMEARNKYFPEGTNVLMVTIIGSRNWEQVAPLSKQEIMAEITDVLKNMYGEKAAAPEDILITDWQTNKLFYGAYSNWPIGVSHEDFAKMGAPLGHLYLAGEAYSNFNGFLHGAFFSGQSTARDLYMCILYNTCECGGTQTSGYDGFCPSIMSQLEPCEFCQPPTRT